MMVYEDADATLLRLYESFMESAPQLGKNATYCVPQNIWQKWELILFRRIFGKNETYCVPQNI